ncbi:hypothetical protein B0J12DRAFT_584542 [Macrophomina phaseolina]|uniref:RNAse P Rpr2/Rpp21 subunit n=1 Tax=Macrophomina phaseolina TaxID=35725 RepID=A0ABQ8FU90_9PEZI|nr:hypothetical protein B0J12DRAFT_584542 [Macrophomina phaseolina]
MREISARLKYLDEAAHLLALASPETSSFLESQYSYLLAENDLAGPPSRKKDVCNACGTILVPGISCTVKQEAVAPAKPTRKGGKVETPKVSKSSKMKIYSCSRCSSKTRLPIASNKARMNTPKSMKVSSVPASNAAPPADAPATPAPAASNASSKKRAKARKGGLQALLANSKKDTSSSKGFGLDLMDLMRSE